MSSLKERLEALVQEKELKRGWMASLAKACKIAPASVSDWVSGKSKTMEGENLLIAARFFGVRPDWLASGKGQKWADGSADPPPAPMEAPTFSDEEVHLVEDFRMLPASERLDFYERIHAAAERYREFERERRPATGAEPPQRETRPFGSEPSRVGVNLVPSGIKRYTEDSKPRGGLQLDIGPVPVRLPREASGGGK